MVTDHPFKPCFHDPNIVEALGRNLCLCPYGPWRCHVMGCGKLPEEHEVATPYKGQKGDK